MGLKSKFFPIAVVCAAVVFACSDPEHGSGGSGGSVNTGNVAADELIRAYCGSIRDCCSASGFPGGPLADCEAILSQGEVLQAVVAGKVIFREPERSQCVAYLQGFAP